MFERRRTKRVGKAVKLSMLLVFLGLVIMVIVVYKLYERVYVPNVTLNAEAELFYEDLEGVIYDIYRNCFRSIWY